MCNDFGQVKKAVIKENKAEKQNLNQRDGEPYSLTKSQF